MRIYIDESGVFTAQEKDKESISCIAALVIPTTLEQPLMLSFQQWKSKPSLSKKKDSNGEIKGSKLDETEIASLLLLLSKFDVIIEVVCIDMGMTTNADVEEHRKLIANSFSCSKTGKKVNNQFKKNVLESLSNPLFSQSLSLYKLINNTLSTSIPYYVQRFPKELGSFSWVLDAKNKCITEYEKVLTSVVMPFLQSINFNNPTAILAGEDYSAFSKFLIPPEHLLEPLKSKASDTSLILSINGIMENLSFQQSHQHDGLQLVDIITNCVRRAMRGNLQFDGWRYLSSLVVFRNQPAITVTKFNPEKRCNQPTYAKFVNYFGSCGKQMLVPENIKSKIKKWYIKWSYLHNLPNNSHESIEKTTVEYY